MAERPGLSAAAEAEAEKTVLELLYGRWRSQTLHAGVSLGIFEIVERAPVDAAAIARRLGLDEARLFRLLRALSALGVLDAHGGPAFSLNDAGAMLRSDHPHSMRDAVLLREGPEHTAIWKHLPAIVRDAGPSGFVREYGVAAFEHANRAPSYGDAFNAGMSSQSNLQTRWTLEALQGCDLSTASQVCDVGGGQGHLLAHLLARYPRLTGTVMDRPGVNGSARTSWPDKLGVADRCTFVEGDMFVDVRAADCYLMKMILHDWSDEECVRILRNLHRRAVAPARVFIVEHVISDQGASDYAALFDMHMLCWGSGRERTAAEYRDLLEASGWTWAATWFPPSGALGIIEGCQPPPEAAPRDRS